MEDLERALAHMRGVNERRVGRVERLPFGAALFSDDLPRVWDANLVIADRWQGSAAELRDEVDRVQGGSGLGHRKLVVYDQELGERLARGFAGLDWPFRNRYAVMAWRRAPDRPAEDGVAVEIGWDAFETAKREALRDEPYGSDEEVVRGLLELDRRTAEAIQVTRFGAFVDGEPAAYCELRVEGRTGQVEDVATVPRFRRRGLARAVVLAAAQAAREAGCDLVFLVADTADWPIELYRRLGFDEIGSERNFGRPGN
jgi:ribosomal protein S18 acetylase RimI-like enzyme